MKKNVPNIQRFRAFLQRGLKHFVLGGHIAGDVEAPIILGAYAQWLNMEGTKQLLCLQQRISKLDDDSLLPYQDRCDVKKVVRCGLNLMLVYHRNKWMKPMIEETLLEITMAEI